MKPKVALTLKEATGQESGMSIEVYVDSSNIDQLEAACAKYREETKLPETVETVRNIISKMMPVTGREEILFTTKLEVGGHLNHTLHFPEKWQAEKLHALASLIQIWVAVHNSAGLGWYVGNDTDMWSLFYFDGATTLPLNNLPFRTKELRDHVMNMPGVKELISKAFATK